MKKLSFDTKIQTITLRDNADTTYYHPYPFDFAPWLNLETILSYFGIKLSSLYELEFDDVYVIKGVPGLLGENSAKVLYNGTVIAKGSIDGSNFCDREGKLDIYLDVLKSIYEPK